MTKKTETKMEEEVKTRGKRKSNNSINYLSLHEKCMAYLDFEDGETCDSIVKNINKAITKGILDGPHSQKGRFSKGSAKFGDEHKRFILKWIEEGTQSSSNEIWIHLCSIKKLKKIGYTAVNNYLKRLGRWVIPRLSIAISEKNLLKRRDYCQSNKDVISQQDVLYTDETMFELNRLTTKSSSLKKIQCQRLKNYQHGFGKCFGEAYLLRAFNKFSFLPIK